MIISHPFSYESLDFIKEGGNCLVEFSRIAIIS